MALVVRGGVGGVAAGARRGRWCRGQLFSRRPANAGVGPAAKAVTAEPAGPADADQPGAPAARVRRRSRRGRTGPAASGG